MSSPVQTLYKLDNVGLLLFHPAVNHSNAHFMFPLLIRMRTNPTRAFKGLGDTAGISPRSSSSHEMAHPPPSPGSEKQAKQDLVASESRGTRSTRRHQSAQLFTPLRRCRAPHPTLYLPVTVAKKKYNKQINKRKEKLLETGKTMKTGPNKKHRAQTPRRCGCNQAKDEKHEKSYRAYQSTADEHRTPRRETIFRPSDLFSRLLFLSCGRRTALRVVATRYTYISAGT